MYYIYDIDGNLLARKLAGTEEEFKTEFLGVKIYVSEINLGEKAIVENESIRAMTRLDRIKAKEEELLDGEYIRGNEIITIEKPNNFHFWDTNLNEWVYDTQLEKKSLEEEIGNLEGDLSNLYDELDKAVARKLKMREKQLNEEIEKLNEKIENKYKRYNELEG
jgi:peptidoglycan hydrolase CwlO-like protein